MSHATLTTLLSTALFAACANSSTPTELGVQMALESVARTAPDADAVGFTVEGATLNVDRIDLYLPAGTTCADVDASLLVDPLRCEGDKLRIRGPVAVDLTSGTPDPFLDAIALPGLAFPRVDVELAPGLAEARGATLLANGTREDTREAWVIALSFDGEARFEGELSGATAGSVLLLLDVSGWFAASPVAACLDSGELETLAGVVWLDDHAADVCDDFVDAFSDAVRRSGRMARDADDDGVEDEVGDDRGLGADDTGDDH